jgi:O-antigen/teichoic acid export membrane protein
MAVFVGAEKGLWRVVGTVTVANLAANAIAASLWGANGAATVMILSEAIALAMYWRIYRTRMPSPLGRRYPLSVIAASLGLVAIWWTLHATLDVGPGTGAAVVPRAAALAAAYAALLWSLTHIARHMHRAREKRLHQRNDVA